jgi:hypothetical protein
MVFEHRAQPLVPRAKFILRLLRRAMIAGGIIGASLGLGAVGYHVTEGFDWIDSILNASMILTGMGPVNPVQTTGKLFATFYALFSGIVFLTTAAGCTRPRIGDFPASSCMFRATQRRVREPRRHRILDPSCPSVDTGIGPKKNDREALAPRRG